MSGDEQALASVWTRPARTKRARPELSREQIVSEAIRLLDEEGIDALTMRRLGSRLGAVAPALYYHVSSKDELLELIVDQIYGEIEVAGESADWRGGAVRTARSLRSVILRHPWFGSVIGEAGLVFLGPNMMRASEDILTLFERGGFTLEQADHALNTLIAYVLGSAISEAAYLTMLARSGQSERDLVEQVWPAAEKAAQPYPRLSKLYAIQHRKNPHGTSEADFDRRLDLFLDGLQTWLSPANSASFESAQMTAES
ncbi:TetR/AcrR family transcriptional regulator C-terminal domain-containing protein [Nonomuraea sp. NPDC059007]|uniref:TetR/AcrR family transcriptional regulator C-terminal domain-containing protein n=1 Tax=Nonomuraea sp. NPDC059007 TaxID=3346692 RepID=UPI0036B16760